MDIITRTINQIKICVDIHSDKKIFLEKRFVEENKIDIYNMTTKDVLNLLTHNEDFTPLHLKWEITDKCNLSCPFCYIHNDNTSPKEIVFEQYIPLLEYLIRKGLLFVILTGGECTLHKEFVKIYNFLKERGVFVEIYTNGINCSEEIMRMYQKYKPYRVEISLYDDKFNSVVYKNILKLKEMNINVVAKCTVNKVTYPFFYNIKEWCKQNEILFYFSTDVFNAYDGRKMDIYHLDENELIEIDILRLRGIKKDKKEKRCFDCGAGKYAFFMNEKELKPCPKIKFGVDIFNNTPEKILKDLRMYILNNKGKKIYGCCECKVSFLCKMCIARTDETKNEHYYVDQQYCQKIKKYYDKIKDLI